MAGYNYQNNLDTQVCPQCKKKRTKDWFSKRSRICKRCWSIDRDRAKVKHTHLVAKDILEDLPDLAPGSPILHAMPCAELYTLELPPIDAIRESYAAQAA